VTSLRRRQYPRARRGRRRRRRQNQRSPRPRCCRPLVWSRQQSRSPCRLSRLHPSKSPKIARSPRRQSLSSRRLQPQPWNLRCHKHASRRRPYRHLPSSSSPNRIWPPRRPRRHQKSSLRVAWFRQRCGCESKNSGRRHRLRRFPAARCRESSRGRFREPSGRHRQRRRDHRPRARLRYPRDRLYNRQLDRPRARRLDRRHIRDREPVRQCHPAVHGPCRLSQFVLSNPEPSGRVKFHRVPVLRVLRCGHRCQVRGRRPSHGASRLSARLLRQCRQSRRLYRARSRSPRE
jgi:hypothetical protein